MREFVGAAFIGLLGVRLLLVVEKGLLLADFGLQLFHFKLDPALKLGGHLDELAEKVAHSVREGCVLFCFELAVEVWQTCFCHLLQKQLGVFFRFSLGLAL